MRTCILTLVLILFPFTALAAEADKLNGYWVSDLMAVEINLAKGSYDAVALGQEKKSKVKVMKEDGNTVQLDVNGQAFTATIVDADNIIMAKAGGIPVKMTRRTKP